MRLDMREGKPSNLHDPTRQDYATINYLHFSATSATAAKLAELA